jgi:pilus assembly protein Flp/PilA
MRLRRVSSHTPNKRCTGVVHQKKCGTEKTMLVALKSVLDQAGIRLVHEEEGQGLIEYVLIAALISIFAIAAMQLVGPEVSAQFTAVTAALP